MSAATGLKPCATDGSCAADARTLRALRGRDLLAAGLTFVVACASAVSAQAPAASGVPRALTLEQALQYALDHYPSVRAALEEVNVSAENVRVARSAYLPRFDALWQTNRATANNIFGQLIPQAVLPSISGPVLPSTSSHTVWGSAAGGLFSWEALDFGLRGAAVREAEAGEARTRAQQAVTLLDVQSAVATAFLRVVSSRQALAAAEADVQRRDVLARAARTLADNQLRPGAEASRADAERAAADTRAIQARQAVAIAQATFAQVLGITNAAVDADAARLLDDTAAEKGPDGSGEPAAEHPFVQSRQAEIDLARARESVLDRTDRPRLFLQSGVFARGSGANPDGTFDAGAEGLGLERANWAAGVQVVFPNVFDFASLRARRAAAAAQTRAQRARYDEAVLSVTAQQRTAAAMVEASRAIARNTPIQLAAARLSETQARARYEAGLADIVEVADAQSLLAGAEYLNAAARVDLWRALLAQSVAQGTIAPFLDLVRSGGGP